MHSPTADLLELKNTYKKWAQETDNPALDMKKFRLKTDIDRDGKIDAASIHGLREDFFQKSAAVISQ